MNATLTISRHQVAQVNWKAVTFFYILTCGLSYGLHFLPNLNPGFLPRHNIFTYGLGPIISAFVTRLVFSSVPKIITWTGAKPGRTALFVAVPLVVGTAFGLTNKSGQNPHVYGFLIVVSSILYGLVEEAGWRGFLQDALRPLPTVWRVLLIATLWMGWHFTFLPDLSAVVAGPQIPVWGICGVFILASWGLGNAADQTKAVLVVACLHEAGNLVGSPVALGIIALSWTLLLIFWNRPVAHRLILDKRSWFGQLTVSCLTAMLLGAGHVVAQTDSAYSTVPYGEIQFDQPSPFPVFDDAVL